MENSKEDPRKDASNPAPEENPLDDEAQFAALIKSFSAEDEAIAHQLIPELYTQLRELAHQKLRYQRKNHTLNTTALVHEAYIKLSRQENKVWESRGHFMATAAQVMRHLLINYAEKRNAQKRGSGVNKVSLDAIPEVIDTERAELLLALDDALERLADFDQRGAQIVELKFFGGFTQVEIADLLGVTERTVRRSWVLAKTWIQKELKQEEILL